MSFVRPALTIAAVVHVLATPFEAAQGKPLAPPPIPRASLSPAPGLSLPGTVDSNSPVMWDLDNGERRMFVMTSHSGVPSVASGLAIERLSSAAAIALRPHPGHGVWMEAIVSDDVETWYGYYHNEWPASRCGREDRFVARIGAARSTDRGRTWQDLGVVIQARQNSTSCESTNRYLLGGVGDVSVMLDSNKQYLYFFYSQYPARAEAQGVAVARLQWADRDRPSGRLELWRDGVWDSGGRRRELSPGLPVTGRRMLDWTYPSASPLIAPTQPWHDGDDKVDAFWGPAVHWNSAIQHYVMLLNRAKDESYTQEGIYVSYATQLDDPGSWTTPQKLLNGGRWYPQVVGAATGTGTDKLAGATSRFFMSGRSEWMINFTK